mgnify:FL=1
MCGIIYSKNFRHKPVARKIRRQYFKQRTRGTDGFGFVAVVNNVVVHCRTKYEHQIMSQLKESNGSDEIIFHHRLPTSTINTADTAHPISTGRNKTYRHRYYMVHNGIVHNSEALKQKHKEEFGIRYATELTFKNSQKIKEIAFNDSEALLHELALFLEGQKDTIEAKGSTAFVMVETDKKNRPLNLWFGRNDGSPLRIQYVKGNYLTISSEGEGTRVDVNKLYKLNYETGNITDKDLIFPSGWNSNDFKSIDHYSTDGIDKEYAKSFSGEYLGDMDWNKDTEHELMAYLKDLSGDELGSLRNEWLEQYDELNSQHHRHNQMDNYDEAEELKQDMLDMSYQMKLLDDEVMSRLGIDSEDYNERYKDLGVA